VEKNKNLRLKISNYYPETKLYSSLDSALKNETLLGFTVATPSETHYNISKKILKAKRHILVEKPLALNLEHAIKLIDLADNKGVNLMVGHVLLFHPAIIKIKKLIDSGEIGALQYIYSNRLNLGQIRSEENVFWSLAPHDIAIFQYLTDSKANYIKAHGSNFIQEGIHDSSVTLLKYENGTEGHIFVSWLHPFKEHRLVIIGSEKMITFEDSSKDKHLKIYTKKFELSDGIPEKIDGSIEIIEYQHKMPLEEELRYFSEHLGSKKVTINTGEQALEVIKILVDASNQL